MIVHAIEDGKTLIPQGLPPDTDSAPWEAGRRRGLAGPRARPQLASSCPKATRFTARRVIRTAPSRARRYASPRRGHTLDGAKFRRQQPLEPFVVEFFCEASRTHPRERVTRLRGDAAPRGAHRRRGRGRADYLQKASSLVQPGSFALHDFTGTNVKQDAPTQSTATSMHDAGA